MASTVSLAALVIQLWEVLVLLSFAVRMSSYQEDNPRQNTECQMKTCDVVVFTKRPYEREIQKQSIAKAVSTVRGKSGFREGDNISVEPN